MTDEPLRGDELIGHDRRGHGSGNVLKRFMVKYAWQCLMGSSVIVVGAVLSFGQGWLSVPGRLNRLEAQQGNILARQRADSARTDSLYRMQSGVVSVLCFGLSDKAFTAAQTLCGEAFHVSRVVADERTRSQRP